MKNKRKYFKKKSKISGVIEKHIKSNARLYSIALIIFVCGIILGVIVINNSPRENMDEIMGYIGNFIESVKSKQYSVDGKKLLIKSVISNVKLAAIIWGAGLIVIGIPIISICVLYKGIRIGYSISAIIATLGKQKGIVFAVSTLLMQNIIAIPCILALMVSSMKMCRCVMKNCNKETLKGEIYRHTIFSLIMTIGLILSSFCEFYFTSSFLCDIIIDFV